MLPLKRWRQSLTNWNSCIICQNSAEIIKVAASPNIDKPNEASEIGESCKEDLYTEVLGPPGNRFWITSKYGDETAFSHVPWIL